MSEIEDPAPPVPEPEPIPSPDPAPPPRAVNGKVNGNKQAASLRRARRANHRLEMEWILVPAIVIVVLLIGFGAKLLLG